MTKAIHNPDKTVQRVPTKLVHIVFKSNSLPSHLVIHFEILQVKPKAKSVVHSKYCFRYHPTHLCRSYIQKNVQMKENVSTVRPIIYR